MGKDPIWFYPDEGLSGPLSGPHQESSLQHVDADLDTPFEIPNPSSYFKRFNIKPRTFERFLVLRYLFDPTLMWLSLDQWSFTFGVLRESPKVLSDNGAPFLEHKGGVETLFSLFLRVLLERTSPGSKPDKATRRAIIGELTDSGFDTFGLNQEYRSLLKSGLGRFLDRIESVRRSRIKVKEPQRRRSSEDSRGKPRIRPWRPSRVEKLDGPIPVSVPFEYFIKMMRLNLEFRISKLTKP